VFPAAYRHLLEIRRARLPLIASVIGRLPIALSGLAAIFLVQAETGSFTDAGVVEACYTVGAAIGLPAQGRLVDRVGQTRVLVPASLASAAALAAFVIAARDGSGVAVLGALNLVAGLTYPPLSQCMRGLWSALLDDQDALQSAYALDAVVIELAFISGPLLAAVVAASVSPSAAVILGLVLTLSGGLMFAATEASRSWRPAGAPRHWAGPLRSSGIWVLVGASLGFGLANGALALALTAFGHQHNATEIVGPFISIQAAASMLGGIWYGARRWASPPEDRYPRLNLLLALGFLPLVFAGSLPVMGVLMLVAGLAIAPAAAVEYVLIDRLAPAGTSIEAFGWVITATVLGSGIGSAIGGAAVNGGHIQLGFILALAGAALAWAASQLGRPALRPSPEPSRA
jgi:predicted MFS family arabinose efflux permease